MNAVRDADVVGLLAADPLRAGLFCDFDGTLTPIVDDPAAARLDPANADLLADLARRLGLVAIVSGRPASFLGAEVALPGVRLLGIYGLEEWRDGRVIPRPEAARWEGAVRDARDRLPGLIADLDGVTLEDKGLSVAVHWRSAPDREAAGHEVQRIVADVARTTGLAPEPGKLVAELRPPVDWDKGAAVRATTRDAGVDRLAYVGDDRGDLAAFEAVREAGGICVAVHHGAETPAELVHAADAVVDGPEGVHALLAALRAALS